MKAVVCDFCKQAVSEDGCYILGFRELFLYQTKPKKGSIQTKRGKEKRRFDMCQKCAQEMMRWINGKLGIESDEERYWVRKSF